MSWRDSYDNSGGPSGGVSPMDQMARLGQLLNRSFHLFTFQGIAVRVHITLLLVFGYFLLRPLFETGSTLRDFTWPLKLLPIMFVSILLHEFGHCFACRRVGGSANEILMWPLGGLAYCAPPNTPRANFITVLWGPMVNLILAAIAYAIITAAVGPAHTVSLHPFKPWMRIAAPNFAIDLLQLVWAVNYILLLFNVVMVFYPFDGGRMLQCALWAKLGYAKATLIACRVGMAGAIAVGLFGLLLGGGLMLVLVAVFGFSACRNQLMMLRAYGEPGQTFDPGYYNQRQDQVRQPGRVARWRAAQQRKKAARQGEREEKALAEVDRILDKLRDQGMASLTDAEKKTLARETDRQNRAG